jgi:hypothetical protein
MRALTLVAAASTSEDPDPRTLPVGERDARLLALRDATFGKTLESVAVCAACGEKVELCFTSDDVRAPKHAAAGPPLRVEGYEIEWRVPTSADLIALLPEAGAEAARRQLIERCVVRASRAEESVAPADLPLAVRDALARAVEEADPQADVELAMACPECTHRSAIAFDVATFFWEELNAWAQRTLRDVHALALAYGWAERDILAMTPFRRQLYMEMLGA